jgi:hypothetical protein
VTILALNAAATWAMVGVIWTIQLVHYPMLATMSQLMPSAAAIDHQRRIVWVVGPLMATEGVTTLILLVHRPASMSAMAAWGAAALLGLALGSTVAVQVPLHSQLAVGHDARVAHRLVATNWVRTAAWTARGIVVLVVLI